MTVTITKAAVVAGLMAGSYSEETRAEVVAIVQELDDKLDRALDENDKLRAENQKRIQFLFNAGAENAKLGVKVLELEFENERLKKRPPLIGPV